MDEKLSWTISALLFKDPDSYTKAENLFEDGEWAILEWSGGGTFQPTGKTFALRGCGFFRVKDDRIVFQRGYWDKFTWFAQIGLPVERRTLRGTK